MADKQKAEECKAKGNTAFSAKNYDEAITHFSEAINHDGSNHVYFSNRSACFASKSNFDLALEDADKCISIKPDWAKGYARKGAALFGQAKYDDAMEVYNKGLEFEPTNDMLKRGIAEVESAMDSQMGGANDMFGNLFSNPNLWAKINSSPKLKPFTSQPDFVAMVNDLVANPKNIGSYLQDKRIMALLGELMGINMSTGEDFAGGMGGDPAPPAPKAAPAKPAEPPKPDYSKMSDDEAAALPEGEQAARKKELGNAAYKARRFEEALALYAEAAALVPTEMTFLNNRAAVYFEQKEYDLCVAECQAAVELGRANRADFQTVAKAYARMGNALAKKEDLAGAVKALENSLVEHHTDAVYRQKQTLQKKIKLAEESAYLDDAKAAEAKAEGNELFKQGDFVAAVKLYSEAVRRNPKDHLIYSNRAACYTKLMDFASGIKDCEKCLEIEPTFVKAYIRKANIQFFMKDYHKAMETYRAGLQLDPEATELKEGLQRVVNAINGPSQTEDGKPDQERMARAMQDPEVQGIMRDPVMQSVLEEMQRDPAAAGKHMRDPGVAAKIEKLMAAGIISVK